MLLLGGLLSFAVCVAAVPIVARSAWKIGAIDVPKDWRRMHRRSVPRIGGLAIFFSIGLCGMFLGLFHTTFHAALAGGLLVLAVGFCDDIKRLPAGAKLLMQALSASLTVFSLGDYQGFSFFLAVLWILVLTNAHNFIDGLDGLLCGAGAVESLGLALLFLLEGQGSLARACILVLGACVGFLMYNRPPAHIFAGDCGSGSIGFLLGTLSLPLFAGIDWGLGILTPLFLFAYPITDLSIAVMRRLLRGKSPFAADRAHLHHRICATGVSHATCTVILVLLSFVLAATGCLLRKESFSALAMLASLFAVVLMVRIRRFLLLFAQSG